jgi:disulfide oxidoreductase YuzD
MSYNVVFEGKPRTSCAHIRTYTCFPSAEVFLAELPTHLQDTNVVAVGVSSKDAERISPQEVVNIMLTHGIRNACDLHPELAKHINKIADADRSYPVMVYEDTVLDGMHRLAQIVINQQTNLGQDFITIKRLQSIPKAALIEDHKSE